MNIRYVTHELWRNVFNKTLLFFALFSAFVTEAQITTTVTFSYTGSMQTFVVPSCVSSITIDARGAQGGQSNDRVPSNSNGGLGGKAIGVLSVTSGQTLYINVGGVGNINGNGGFNGGGVGGVSTAGSSCLGGPAAGGGGASDVRVGGTALSNRVIVAGGGGGSGRDYCNGTCQPCGCGGSGGSGGGTTGVVGVAAGNCGFGYAGLNTNGGSGGGTSAGGSGGIGDNGGVSGTSGSLGTGGNGAGGSYDVSGGGGGGGYYGGGGGGSASSGSGVGGGGGGGGSSYITGLSGASTTPSVQTGNGVVELRYVYNGQGVNLTASSTSICAGQSVTLTASNVLSYTWTPGGSNLTSFTAAPTTTTTYTVQGTNNLGCISTAVVTISVDAGTPTLSIVNTASATGGICPTTTAALTASGATTYSWNNSISNGIPFSPANTLTYVVTGVNACGTSTAATSISVHPLPNVSGVVSQPTICSNVQVSFTGVGNAVTYSWSSGIPNGTPISVSSSGNFTVTGTSAQNCTNSAVVGVTVVTLPTNPPIPSPQLICIGSSATISSSGATNYTWTTPSGPVSGSSIVVSPTITSTYTLTKSNSNCVDTQTLNIFVNQLPSIFSIVSPTIVCASHTAALQAAGAQTYTWTAPSYSAIGSSPVVSPSVSTMYTVTASDGTCVNTSTVFLATNPNPTINIVPTSSVICQGDNVSLTASGAIGYSWTTVGIVSNTNNPTITETPTSSTLYQVTGINNFNCTSTSQQVVVVQATPTLVINTNKPLVCSGAASNLTVNAVQGVQCTYIWSPNAGSATSSVVTVNPLSTTFYTAIGTAPNGCTATVNYPVSVFLPTFAVNNPTSSCLGGTINLIASGANSYTWNGTAPFAQISVSPPTATVYVCAATSNSTGVNCVSTQTVQVSIYSNPTITAVPSRTQICRGEETEITGGGAVSYAWNTGQTGSVVPVNPIANTVYTVVGTDINGCVGTTTVLVKTSICYGIEELNKLSNFGIAIYPNPNTGNFTIQSESDLALEFTNELGQTIQKVNLTSANNHKIQVTEVANGIYFLTGKKGNYLIREKIVVQK